MMLQPTLDTPPERSKGRPRQERSQPPAQVEEKTISNADRQAREQRDQASLEAVLASLEQFPDPEPDAVLDTSSTRREYRQELYGDFEHERRLGGNIVLERDADAAMSNLASDFRREAKSVTNFITGERIAAEYDSPTGNFRAQTRLVDLPDGRQVFMLYDHRGSVVHRLLDGMMKRANGLPMRKADRGEWKAWHDERTGIPQIVHNNPHLIAMPYVPNVIAKDLLANNAKIDAFGDDFEWAKQADLDEKNATVGTIIDEVRRFHGTEAGKRGWGEAVLSNVILTEQKQAVLCDFEVKYKKSVSDVEAKARDLKDLCMSIAAALELAHGQSVGESVKLVLDRYPDAEVLAELKRLASKKRNIFQAAFFGYEQARTGTTGKKQYDAICAAIVAYAAPETSAKKEAPPDRMSDGSGA